MSKKNIREKFRNDVFKRDNYTCKICGYGPFEIRSSEIFDAHHITDRSLMPNGGYVKENGITVCKDVRESDPDYELPLLSCHMRCEQYHISNGEQWEDNLHPDDLYRIVDSTLELATNKSENLK